MKRTKCFLIFLISTMACRKSYNPPATTSPNSYLVVEGVINTGSDSTTIKLSRTVNLSSGITTNPDSNDVVTVESDANISYPLKEIRAGYYTSASLNLDNTRKYRLRITSNNQQYVSDFVVAKVTPPIDSLGYNILSNGLQIYVNSNDPNNNTHYYRWDYEETWQFHSKYLSHLIVNNNAFLPRSPAQYIYNCFAGDVSSTVILSSTAKLNKDLIYQQPIVTISATSEKIETKYSILLREYALTGDAFNFWQNLKKNTEQLGSIFDAQPSTFGGNVHNINNPSEPVIGYVSACVVQSKRIFISNSQLPQSGSWIANYPYDCAIDSAYFSDPKFFGLNTVKEFLLNKPPLLIPIDAIYGQTSIIGYSASSDVCVDCTLRGTKKQPAFWR